MNKERRLSDKDHAETSLTLRQKRRKTSLEQKRPYSYKDYTVAWVCALHLEMAAAVAVLDARHEKLPRAINDDNSYELGNIHGHNTVIACLQSQGKTDAANILTDLRRDFTSIKIRLMVGIARGVPSNKADIRLGDVVVGTRVMHCHVGKAIGDDKTEQKMFAALPAQNILSAVSTLRAKHELKLSRIPDILRRTITEDPEHGRPNTPDRLFQATFDHERQTTNCEGCNPSKPVQRSTRSANDPMIHHGGIAFANHDVKLGIAGENFTQDLDILCIEGGAAGLMNMLDCLQIRGICDYSDSHRSKAWQKYAAATAAAYAKDLLDVLPVVEEATNPRHLDTSQIMFMSQTSTRELLDSLRLKRIDARRNSIRSPHANTCHWLLELPEYRSWLDPETIEQHHGLLWIRGKPGVGKSTAMKFLYAVMKKRSHPGAISAAFFFSARGELIERSVYGMYQSILLQLLEGFPDLQTVFDDPLAISHSEHRWLSLNVLKDLLRNAISALGQRSFTCFVDALDECDEQYIMDMMQYFEGLAETCTKNGIKLRTCLSSRHYPYVETRLGLCLILEDQQGHIDDLNSYITEHLQVGDVAVMEELRPKIVEKSAGVFLWVVLVTEMFNQENQIDRLALHKRLQEVPSSLRELFKDMLTRDNEKKDQLLLCFLWILYAKRPLTPKEFYHTLWAGLRLKDEADRDIRHITGPDSVQCFNSFVTTSSKGLAEVTDTWCPNVQFTHESVREFLIKDGGLRELWPESGFSWEGLGHERLKQCCSLYMNYPLVRESIENLRSASQSPSASNALSRKYPFLRYATRQILYHDDCAASEVPQDEFLAQFAVADWISALNLLDKLPIREYSPVASLLYILAEMGLPALIRIRLKYDPEIHILGERYRYPLFAALANGHKSAVAALLDLPKTIYNGVDIAEVCGKDFKDYQEQTPLSWAVKGGRREFVKLLLLKGSNLEDVMDEEGHTPLTWAIVNGHDDMAMLLIQHCASIGACNMDQMTPLMLALQLGNMDVASRLIERGADVNSYCKGDKMAIHLALDQNNESLAEFLIKNGVDINVVSCTPPVTPLLYSLEKGFTSTAMLLIEKGANIKTSLSNDNALMIALQSGCQAAVKIFIDNGADVRTHGPNGLTALHLAARENNHDIVKRLIEKGADINSCDAHGSTPLHLASLAKLSIKDRAGSSPHGKHGLMPPYVVLKASWEAVPKLLIEHGANVNARDDGGSTPLNIALRASCKTVSRLLIKNGADVNARNHEGVMPLHIALRESCETIARLLIENGANANVRDEEGFMPLHRALTRSYTAVARLLIFQRVDIDCLDKYGSTSLHLALENRDEGTATLLIDSAANVNVYNAEGATPLHMALEKGYEALSMLLISNKADVNAHDKDGWAPLHLALIRGWERVARLLVDKGADVNSCTAGGLTPLHLFSNCEAMAKVLIEKGANMNAFDKEYRTPLYLALDCKEMVRILFQKGSTVSILDIYNQTNVYLALKKSSKAVAVFLFGLGAQNGSFAYIGI